MFEPVRPSEGGPAAPCRVFISYAHESDVHMDKVRSLWSLLRDHGIDARFDMPDAHDRRDWTQWMGKQVRTADHVLIVASAAYRRRAENRCVADDGRGVQWEARLIRDAFYRDQQDLNRFVPVVLPGHSVNEVPDFLAPAITTVYHVRDFTVAGAESLLRLLLDQPAEPGPRPLGPVPDLMKVLARDEIRTLRAVERAELHKILDGLPAPDGRTLSALNRQAVERATGLRPAEVARPRTYAELFDELDEYLHLPGDPHPVITCCELIAAWHPGGRDLLTWADRVAQRLGARPVADARRESSSLSAIVRLEPGRQQGYYLVTVWCFYGPGDADVEYQSARAMPMPQVRARLRKALSDALDKLALRQHAAGSTNALLVEFALPPELFGEAVDEWLVGEDDHVSERIGWLYPTVLRDVGRLRHPRLHARWRENWGSVRDHVRKRGELPLTWFTCEQRPEPDELHKRFFEPGEHSAVAFTRAPLAGPTRQALNVGLRAGVSVMLWRRGECLRSGDGTCDCARFRDSLTDQISGTPLARMPEAVHGLREHGLVLLWDDPFRWPAPPDRFLEPFWQGDPR